MEPLSPDLREMLSRSSPDTDRAAREDEQTPVRVPEGGLQSSTHAERVGPGIELIGGDEEVERSNRDALGGQAATTAVFWQRVPDAIAPEKGQSRCEIVAPEEIRRLDRELGTNVVLDRHSDPNRSTHLPRARKRRCSSSSWETRLIVPDDSRESETTRSRSAKHSTSSTLGSAGSALPSRSFAPGVAGLAISTTVVDTPDNRPQPTAGGAVPGGQVAHRGSNTSIVSEGGLVP